MKITKPLLSKHKESLIPFVKDFVDTATTLPLPLLPDHLASFPSRWPFPRGDLYHWIPLLNRFDTILEEFTKTYQLRDGPQTREFTCEYLQRSLSSENANPESTAQKYDLDLLKSNPDGDRQLVEAVLDFSRLLLENCGNRSIYASSAYLNDLLNTTSLTLLNSALQLGSQLAQRYQASLKRMGTPSRSLSSALLLNHYNVNLERVQQLAQPFTKTTVRTDQIPPSTPITPGTAGKNKEKGFPSSPAAVTSKTSVVTSYGTDLAAIANVNAETQHWEEWGTVRLVYHVKAAESEQAGSTWVPSTPTPLRRTSSLGNPQTPRAKTTEDPTSPQIRSQSEDASSPRTLEISSSKMKSTSIHEIIKEYSSSLPEDAQHDLLNRLRVAYALTNSLETRRQILAIRVLAITNLAYIHSEQALQEKVLRQDTDEPRRLQLVYQLTELVHPPSEGQESLPRWLQSIALAALAALTQHSSKQTDVSIALNTQLSHGVMLYIVRRAVAEMATDQGDDRRTVDDEWRDCLFSLLHCLLGHPRTTQDLATAGIQPILVEALNLRTNVAERNAQKILNLFDGILYNVRDAFQMFVDAGGLDALSNLMVYEVSTSSDLVKSGNGIRADYRSPAMDYQIPHYKYQTLKWLVKFIHTMMSSAASYSGNFERLLRNLIDSSQLLASLRQTISDGRCFGSSVWANAVSIVNEFINNEPTSYAIIAEAGLSKTILEAVSGKEVQSVPTRQNSQAPDQPEGVSSSQADEESMADSPEEITLPPDFDNLEISSSEKLAGGILPAREAINVIPNAFSAICLNNAGMKMFQNSDALQTFFQIFLSEEHVKCLDRNEGLASSLGSSFDELVRHHPPLKQSVLNCTLHTVARLGQLCNLKGQEGSAGASLWPGQTQKGKGKAVDDGDVEMSDASEPLKNDDFAAKKAVDEAAVPYLSSMVSFLHSLFLNSTMRNNFIDKGGLEYVLDLAELPCLPLTFAGSSVSQTLNTVISFLADHRPALVFPSLLKRSLKALQSLKSFTEHDVSSAYFDNLITPEGVSDREQLDTGTRMLKALINVESLLLALQQCISLGYPRGQSTGLTTLNFNDYYMDLIRQLGPLLTASSMEGFLLKKIAPQSWASGTELGEFKLSEEMNEIFGQTEPGASLDGPRDPTTPAPEQASTEKSADEKLDVSRDKRSPQYCNYKILRYILDVTASTIPLFFQSIGRVMTPKRYVEKHTPVAETMASVAYKQLNLFNNEKALDNLDYISRALDTARHVLVDNLPPAQGPPGATTLVLSQFHELGGIAVLNDLLRLTSSQITQSEKPASDVEPSSKSDLSYQCTKKILDIYIVLGNAKSYSDSNSLRDRERRYTSSPQLLIELRCKILHTVRQLWESDLVEKASSDILERMIEIIRTIANADGESGAHKRSDRPNAPSKPAKKQWKTNADSVTRLMEDGYQRDLAEEALYRCNNSMALASEYCRAHQLTRTYDRNPIPVDEIAATRPSTGTATPDTNAMILDDSASGAVVSVSDHDASAPQLPSAMESDSPSQTFNELLLGIDPDLRSAVGSSTPLSLPEAIPARSNQSTPAKASPSVQTPYTCIEDLEEERDGIRQNLIDRCLEVINSHGDVTFQISDLIKTVVTKSPAQSAAKSEVGETLVNALISFAAEEDIRPVGKKLAAYAHLLALLIQDHGFYDATVKELRFHLSTLISFIRLPQDHSSDEPSPWIPNVLVVIETLLSEDEQPPEYDWKAPSSVKDTLEQAVQKFRETVVQDSDRTALFEALLDILPRVSKNDTLALAILRILVILTRSRPMAEAMGERKNLQRLFVMAKQLGGAITPRLRNPIMLVLRHIIEDKETIEQVMRSEVIDFFESPRAQRHVDVQTYLRQLAHLVIRDHALFIKVSGEVVKLMKYNLDSPEPHGRLVITLKQDVLESKSDNPVLPPIQDAGDLSLSDIKPSTETTSDTPEKPKPVTEHKTPVVENPDGVIHFLLRELMNYRDVEDKEPAPALTSSTLENSEEKSAGASNQTTADEQSRPDDSKDSKKPSKQEFRPDEHPIHVYRCFILQCLAELLSCYNRTKLEFLNFKKNAPQQSMTPSKPRSSVINYLLFDLIPIGTLEHVETVSMKKKTMVSHWADSVITGLLGKTTEHRVDQSRDTLEVDEEPDLLFVRRFVLENILKAYKEATVSTEPLDVKYSRMLGLAELMSHVMLGKDNNNVTIHSVSTRSGRQLRRIMYEKGFIAALTSSIADIDLNIPGARRAVKYILRPLKALTQTAIEMSDLNLPVGGQAEEEEIFSASSLSDMEDEREETPDLFRGSALGMFDTGRDHASSSEDGDDDGEQMFEEYDEDGMDYDEEMADDDEENISDEDEEIEGIGPIEGLPGDHGVDVEVIMEDDEDDESDEEGSEDDSDEDSDDMDEDDDHGHMIDIIDEDGVIHGEDGGDDDEWSDEDDEEDYEGEVMDDDEEHAHGMGHGALGHLMHALGGDDHEGAVNIIERLEEGGLGDEEEPFDLAGYIDERHEGFNDEGQDGEETDEEEEEDAEEDELLYEEFVDGDVNVPSPFIWTEAQPPIVINHRGPTHHHRPRHGISNPFTLPLGDPRNPSSGRLGFPRIQPGERVELSVQLQGVPPGIAGSPERAAALRPLILSRVFDALSRRVNETNPATVPDYGVPYRSHRPGIGPRDNDDGANPLLQRTGSGSRDGGRGGSWSQMVTPGGIFDFGFGRGPFADGPGAILSDLINSLPLPGTGGLGRHGHALHFHVTGPSRDIAREMQAMFGMREPNRFENRRDPITEAGTFDFVPQSTSSRWQDEAKMLFGGVTSDKSHRVINAIVAALVPIAFEDYKQQKAAQEQKQREEEEIRRKKEEELALQRAKEAEERAAREKKEAEEREAARLAAEAAAAEAAAEAPLDNASEPQQMEGVESTETERLAADVPRVYTTIRGEQVDITDLGIDALFLEEIPEDLREEVIMATIAERRLQAEELDQEFLGVLPESFREDLLAQERRFRRREREEQRRQERANAPQEVDAASILATFPPDLRNQVLLEQDESLLAQLPPDLADEARALAREYGIADNRMPQIVHVGGNARRNASEHREERPTETRPQRRAVTQMLDKSGVATLLRLMFILQQGSLRNSLFSVLQNISENRQNRAEVISTLLHILQDGSADMSAVERSFAHLSLRARQPKDSKEPRTPFSLKRSLTSDLSTVTMNSGISPLTVAQQCLNALVFLCQVNNHVAPFFLTEHDSTFGIKRSFSRKGKGKDSKASKYALNSLLSLLDRPLIMESSAVMETLSYLLNRITQPLQTFERKQKEAEAKIQTEDQAPQASQETEGESAAQGERQAETDTKDTEDDEKKDKDTKDKKPRPPTPPVILDYNLKLVTNIFLARECSSKTFRETISTIKNLSAIPGAKAVFGRELITKAQELAEHILVDLTELLPQIQKAATGTDIQGVALAKFSQTSSDQNKLLRVLTALDHLFDPKTQQKSDDSSTNEKQDTLSQLYENATFGPIWEKLCACLSAIRQRENMLNVATILLPLIESLMVVCKNTTLKDKSPRSIFQKEVAVTSPAPESRMENLFFTFTEDHRKILNDLVRHNPKLMSGTFSLLVKNPKVLDFDNKRNYFTRNIHNRNAQNRQSYPPLQLSVRRDRVLYDSFLSMYYKSGDEIKYGKLSIRFQNEEGVDAGGVTREWFQVLARQMFDPGYVLFTPVSSDRTTFHPNRSSAINDEHLMFFKFIGRIIGKALYEGRVLDCHFSRAVYKRILGKSVSLKDMESLDLDYYKSLVWMLENDITDVITETFSVESDVFGVVETIDLIPDGRNVPVTQENKHEYVRLVTEFKLVGSVQEQLDHFLGGFHDIIPAELIAIFNEQELELLISGLPEIDVDDWKRNTEYHNYNSTSPQIQWFWRAVRSFDKEERAKLLQFVTGTSKVPLNGFEELEGMNGVSRFNIHRDYGNTDRLPSSHTCFNQLDLPEYTSYEILRHQLLVAITAGSDYFGFA